MGGAVNRGTGPVGTNCSADLVVSSVGGRAAPPPTLSSTRAFAGIDYVLTNAHVEFPAGVREAWVPIYFPESTEFRGNLGIFLSLFRLTNASGDPNGSSANLWVLDTRPPPEIRPRLRVLTTPTAREVTIAVEVDGDAGSLRDMIVSLVGQTYPYTTNRFPDAIVFNRNAVPKTFRFPPTRNGRQTLRGTFTDRWGQTLSSAPLEIDVPLEFRLTATTNADLGRGLQLGVLPFRRDLQIEESTNLLDWEVILPSEFIEYIFRPITLPTLVPEQTFYRAKVLNSGP